MVAVFNTTGEEIPAYSCVQKVSSEEEGSTTPFYDNEEDDERDSYFGAVSRQGMPVFLVKKPDGLRTERDASRYLFTVDSPIPPGKYGVATIDFPLVVASVCTNSKNHDTLGPKSGQWYLTKGNLWKQVSIDPTRAVKGVTEKGKVLQSVIIEPIYYLKTFTTSYARHYFGGGANQGTVTENFGYMTQPGAFAIPANDQEDIEIERSGEYELAAYARLWILKNSSEQPAYPINIEFVRFRSGEDSTIVAGEVLLTLTLNSVDAVDLTAGASHYFVGALFKVESGVVLRQGDILKVRNASTENVRIGGWPTFIDGVDGWVGQPPYWNWGWNGWYGGWPGFYNGWTGWWGGWGSWNYGHNAQAEFRVQYIDAEEFGEEVELDAAECMSDPVTEDPNDTSTPENPSSVVPSCTFYGDGLGGWTLDPASEPCPEGAACAPPAGPSSGPEDTGTGTCGGGEGEGEGGGV